MTTQPLFKDAEHALRFAFAICETEIYTPPAYLQAMVRSMAGKGLRSETMTPHEWHAQGSMIRAMVFRLEPILAAYALATYSWGQERGHALAMIDQYTHETIPHLKSRQLLQLIVRRYVGRGRGARLKPAEIARQTCLHHSTVASWERRIGKVLDDLHWRFFDQTEAELVKSGLIPAE